MTAKVTPAVLELRRRGIPCTVHAYEVARTDRSYGEAVARALGVEAERVFKTLVGVVDGASVVAIVPVSGRLSLKKLARAAGGKHATMAQPAEAERLTGYVVGGISPIAQRRRLPVYADRSLMEHATVFVSAGRRGLQLELDPQDLRAVAGAVLADLTASP